MTLEAGGSGLEEFHVLCGGEVEGSEKVEYFLFFKSLMRRYELESYKILQRFYLAAGKNISLWPTSWHTPSTFFIKAIFWQETG